MVKWLKNEFWNGYTLFEKLFILSMVLLQVIVYCFVPDTPIGIICGIAGCICVVLTAKGKISSYIFNFIQMITYMIICWVREWLRHLLPDRYPVPVPFRFVREYWRSLPLIVVQDLLPQSALPYIPFSRTVYFPRRVYPAPFLDEK